MRQALPYLELFVTDHPHIRPIFIYIEEAHAYDEWPIGSSFVEKQATTLEERRNAASKLQLSDRWTILLDSMDNQFSLAFSPWPFRYYLFDSNGTSKIIAEPVGGALPLGELWNVV